VKNNGENQEELKVKGRRKSIQTRFLSKQTKFITLIEKTNMCVEITGSSVIILTPKKEKSFKLFLKTKQIFKKDVFLN